MTENYPLNNSLTTLIAQEIVHRNKPSNHPALIALLVLAANLSNMLATLYYPDVTAAWWLMRWGGYSTLSLYICYLPLWLYQFHLSYSDSRRHRFYLYKYAFLGVLAAEIVISGILAVWLLSHSVLFIILYGVLLGVRSYQVLSNINREMRHFYYELTHPLAGFKDSRHTWVSLFWWAMVGASYVKEGLAILLNEPAPVKIPLGIWIVGLFHISSSWLLIRTAILNFRRARFHLQMLRSTKGESAK